MINRTRTRLSMAYLDVVFNLLLGVTCLFFLAFLLVKPIPEDKKIDSKAEYIVTLEWPDHHNGDIDLWTLSPLGEAVGYASKELGVASLERDDMGSARDTFYDYNTETTVYNKVNREIITLRGILPGEWVVNVHYYASRPLPTGHISGKSRTWPDTKRIPAEVEVKVIRLNPTYQVLAQKKLLLTFQGEQRTAARFILDETGAIVERIDEPFMFVTSAQQNAFGDFESDGRVPTSAFGDGH